MTLQESFFKKGDNENQPLLAQSDFRYPKSVFFIIFNEFCERFNYYGLRTILLIYLIQKLNYDEATATVIFHLSAMTVYLCSLIGAIVADSWWGKFKTILWLSIVYVAGSAVIAIGAVEPWNMPARTFTILGLLLFALGSGGIKTCVSAFGGEQFTLPEQEKQLQKFFSIFYFVVNLGSLITTFITPLLRNTSCFNMDECFVAGFGLPAFLMVLAIILFMSGKSLYKKVPPKDNMMLRVCKCVWTSIDIKSPNSLNNNRAHWLDYAEEKHGKSTVHDCKILFNVLVLYLPLPLFWALFDQQGSRWVSQAIKLDGNFSSFTIHPDQMQITNPLLILTFIPLCQLAIYPTLQFVGICRPLQKMTLGGVLAGVSFLCSMFLELKIEAALPDKLNMLWQLPQIAILTLAEVMFVVTGNEFAFTQAPKSMKSVMQAFWMLTVACGELIVTLVVGSRILSNQAMEYLLFAVLMFVDMFVFMILAVRYKPIDPNDQKINL